MQTNLNTQLVLLPRPSKKLRWKQIHISSFDTAHRQFSNTPEGNFQDQ